MKRRILGSLFLSLTLGSGTLLAGTRVYVRVAPPRPPAEVRIVAPGPGHVWIGGFHRWDGNAYVWVPGRWAVAPHPHAVWRAGHWKHSHHGWYWVDGHWR